jgi:hypothetical protein
MLLDPEFDRSCIEESFVELKCAIIVAGSKRKGSGKRRPKGG